MSFATRSFPSGPMRADRAIATRVFSPAGFCLTMRRTGRTSLSEAKLATAPSFTIAMKFCLSSSLSIGLFSVCAFFIGVSATYVLPNEDENPVERNNFVATGFRGCLGNIYSEDSRRKNKEKWKMKKRNWFDVDKDGLRKLVADRAPSFVLWKLIQNGWDEPSVTEVKVKLTRDP